VTVHVNLAQFTVDHCMSFSPSQTALLRYRKGTGSLTTTPRQNIEDSQLSLTENRRFFPAPREQSRRHHLPVDLPIPCTIFKLICK
jgi:hypothetical protein